MAIGDILNISFEFSSKVGTRQLPHLNKDYESNVAGLYIVGDLADAPVIKIALNQGYDVADRMFEKSFGGNPPAAQDGVVDVAILGAGPSGIGASLACKKNGLSFELIERERPFNTIQNYPKHKHVFSEPRDFGPSNRFPFMDNVKEDLVGIWSKALEDNDLMVHQPQEVVGITRKGDLFEVAIRAGEGASFDGQPVDIGAKRSFLARRVILAIGRRGTVNKIGCPGEDLDKVAYGLSDPDKHKGEKVLVVGGGDSAVEAAVALSKAGADVHISYRKPSFIRAKLLNKERIEAKIGQGAVTALYESTVNEIKPDSVVVNAKEGETEIDNDRVFVLIGTKLPMPFLKKVGIMMEGQFTWQRMAFISLFAVITYAFYCIKAYGKIAKVAEYYWPFGPGHPLAFLHEALRVNLGWRTVDGGFWGTVAYSVMIVVLGVIAMRRYNSPLQTRRYLSLMGFQLVFLFGVPELIGPFVIEGGEGWRLYALSVPWPLWTGSITHTTPVKMNWIIAGAAVAFVGMPLFVRYNGERFCSWMCGCGGLAETLGDRWRHLAPRGSTAKSLERFGIVILAFAAGTTILILAQDVWGMLKAQAWTDTRLFAEHWYKLMVDFWFASVVGVGFYPYLGNRVWCRFICPLRAYMELLARWFSRLKIVANDKCIGCGECTRYCQMSIPVQKFAQMRADLANHNSACIQCGICVEVCPMNVLEVVRGKSSARSEAGTRALPIVT